MSTTITISLHTENVMKYHHYQKIIGIGMVIENTFRLCLHENKLQWQTPEFGCLECQLFYSQCECSDLDINDDELSKFKTK